MTHTTKKVPFKNGFVFPSGSMHEQWGKMWRSTKKREEKEYSVLTDLCQQYLLA